MLVPSASAGRYAARNRGGLSTLCRALRATGGHDGHAFLYVDAARQATAAQPYGWSFAPFLAMTTCPLFRWITLWANRQSRQFHVGNGRVVSACSFIEPSLNAEISAFSTTSGVEFIRIMFLVWRSTIYGRFVDHLTAPVPDLTSIPRGALSSPALTRPWRERRLPE
jgi:hypothetical protein